MRPIPGFPDYFASEKGHIHSTRKGTVRQLKGAPDRDGYLRFWPAGARQPVMVHRIIALAFHGPAPAGENVCRHLNGNRQDNRPENLSWGSVQENLEDQRRHGTLLTVNPRGGVRSSPSISNAKLSVEQVHEIRRLYGSGLLLREVAAQFGIGISQAGRIARGETWVTTLGTLGRVRRGKGSRPGPK